MSSHSYYSLLFNLYQEPLPFELNLKTLWLARPLHFVQEIDSTNRLLQELARAGARAGTVILTDYQQAGRGRRGREWVTPPGSSLLFSSLFSLPTLNERLSLLPLVIAIAVAQTVEDELELHPQIKWPNDILLAGRKCCGILVESEWDGTGTAKIIIGIGLNVNQQPAEFGKLADATSLRIEVGHEIERGKLFAALLQRLELLLDKFKAGWQPHQAWRQRATWLGQPISVQRADGSILLAKAIDIAQEGSLLVQYENHQIEALQAGEVSIRQHKINPQGLSHER